MTVDRDLARLVRVWLRTDEHESPDRVLANVFERLDATPQRRSWRRLGWSTDTRSSARLVIAGAALVFVAIVGVSLSNGFGSTALGPGGSPSPDATPQRSGSEPPSIAGTEQGRFAPGRYDIPWPMGPSDGRIELTVPAGWAWVGGGAPTIYRDHGRFYAFPVDIGVHAVSRVVTSVCPLDGSPDEVGPTYVDVGPSVEDLTSALLNIVGTQWSGPEAVTVGGYPAQRLATTYSSDSCPGPTRRYIWDDDSGSFFVENRATSTVYVIDVAGDRLVTTTEVRGATPDDLAQLGGVLDSIVIRRQVASGDSATPSPRPQVSGLFPLAVGPDADLRIGRHSAVVDGVPFSFGVLDDGWEPQRPFYISKSTRGPQGAEGIVRWSTYPTSVHIELCPGLLPAKSPASPSALAAAVASAPGVELVSGPSELTLDGRPGTRVVVTVRQDLGCDPGYFYSYEAVNGGALWLETEPGDTISVWIVDVGDRLLVIEAETTPDAGQSLEREISEIIGSMRFR